MCLNKINATMFTGDDCNIKCTGDESLTCGGRGHASVYSSNNFNCLISAQFMDSASESSISDRLQADR